MQSPSRRDVLVVAAGAALGSLPLTIAHAQDKADTERHGISAFGDLKYPSDFKNFSYAVDRNTKTPLVEPPRAAEIHVVSFEMQKIDGVWKVVDGTRYEIQRPS